MNRLVFAAFVFDGDKPGTPAPNPVPAPAPAGADAGLLNRLPFTTGLGKADPEPPPKKLLGAFGLFVPLSKELDKEDVDNDVELPAGDPVPAPAPAPIPMPAAVPGAGAAEFSNKDPLKVLALVGVLAGLARVVPPPVAGHPPKAVPPVALSNARFLSADVETAPVRLIGNG